VVTDAEGAAFQKFACAVDAGVQQPLERSAAGFGDEPSDYWLSGLPADTTLTDLVQLAKSRWRIEHDYRELKTGLGLDHFEGRSWTGWHRHVILTATAQLFLTQLRLANPQAAGQPRASTPSYGTCNTNSAPGSASAHTATNPHRPNEVLLVRQPPFVKVTSDPATTRTATA